MPPQALILQPNWFSLLPNQPLGWEALHVLSRTTKAVLVLLLYAGEHSQQQGKWHKAPSCNPWRACSLGLVYYPQCNSKSTAKHMATVPRGFPSSGQPGQRVTLSPLITVLFLPLVPAAIWPPRITSIPYWLCLPFPTMFASKLNRMKLKFSGISDGEKKFSALKVHGKHFNGHKIRAFVPTAKGQ